MMKMDRAAFDFDNSGELDQVEFMSFMKLLKKTDTAAGGCKFTRNPSVACAKHRCIPTLDGYSDRLRRDDR